MAELDVYQRPDNNGGWRLVSDNGNVIATGGGQGYEHESVAQKMAEQVVTGHYKDARPTPKGLHEKQETRVSPACRPRRGRSPRPMGTAGGFVVPPRPLPGGG